MKATILDTIKEKNSSCFLVKIDLKDFVSSLPQDYENYAVQREIVSNTYLDNLIETVLEKKHIPTIVLVLDEGEYTINVDEMKIDKFKILDGLQRTYRLNAIWKTIQLFKNEISASNNILDLKRIQLSKNYSTSLNEINSNSRILESICTFYKNKKEQINDYDIEECFNHNQWFEVWTKLTPQDEVKKMLILNAGHKPVKTQHQLELLFLHLIPIIQKSGLDKFKLLRQKESNVTSFSKNREEGQFHFSHLITSILSLNEGKPVTANVDLVHKTQSSDFETEQYDKYFNYDFLHKFISVLLEIDKSLTNEFKDVGIKWLGRETTLVGMFAALGKFGKTNALNPVELLQKLETLIVKNPSNLNLLNFEDAKKSLDIGKINIGTVNKNAVFNGIFNLLEKGTSLIEWSKYFKA